MMADTKFTTGPWQWVGDDEIEQVEHPFTSVAEVVRIHKDHDGTERNANARLIAAAPNLLYALERVIEEFAGDASEEQLRESGYSATLYKAVTIGRAAIRKARTGE